MKKKGRETKIYQYSYAIFSSLKCNFKKDVICIEMAIWQRKYENSWN